MDINHLHLAVKSVEKSKNFYQSFFKFEELKWIGDMLFMVNDEGFELALDPIESFQSLPDWFHFGFRLSKDELEALYKKLSEVPGVIESEYKDHGGWGSFACVDPDGHGIEVYWDK